jgi:hypothetical protein
VVGRLRYAPTARLSVAPRLLTSTRETPLLPGMGVGEKEGPNPHPAYINLKTSVATCKRHAHTCLHFQPTSVTVCRVSKAVRIREHLYEEIGRLATQERRSLIAQLEVLLEQALAIESGERGFARIELATDEPREGIEMLPGVEAGLTEREQGHREEGARVAARQETPPTGPRRRSADSPTSGSVASRSVNPDSGGADVGASPAPGRARASNRVTPPDKHFKPDPKK